MRTVLMCAAALLAPMAALADDTPPTTPPLAVAPAPTPDAATMAAAQKVAAHLMPPGIYKKMMGPMMSKMMDGMMDKIATMPLGDLAELGGANHTDVAKLDKTTMGQIMAIRDPAYKQRTSIMMSSMFSSMGDLMGQFEPQLRDGYAGVYANRFSLSQLNELNAFFDTPTGNSYASQSMLVAMDPTFMDKMMTMMPSLMKAMPDIMKRAMAATEAAHLPPPRANKDLTAVERAQLKKLLGSVK